MRNSADITASSPTPIGHSIPKTGKFLAEENARLKAQLDEFARTHPEPGTCTCVTCEDVEKYVLQMVTLRNESDRLRAQIRALEDAQ